MSVKLHLDAVVAPPVPVVADSMNEQPSLAWANGVFAIKNHSSIQTTSGVAPWDYRPAGSVPYDRPKSEFRQWCAHPFTQHFFYSLYEGLNRNLRIGGENPAEKMYGLVIDYDAPLLDADWAGLMERASADFPPAYGSKTQSGNARLVWLFEVPVWVYEKEAHKAFVERLLKELRVTKLLPGFEKEAALDTSKMYEVGREWRKLSDSVIKSETLHYWLFKAAEKGRYNIGDVLVPIELVAAEVQKKFPGRWKGEFVLGARGVRFWDLMADSDTAAIVTETGMVCFTGDSKFVTWRQIFGPRFVERFIEDRTKESTHDIWFDGKDYWKRQGEFYSKLSKESLILHLKVACGLRTTRQLGATSSEVDQALYHIEQNNRVERATPFVHRRPGPLTLSGARCLNIARCRPVKPASEPQEWAENFPFLADFFGTFFSSDDQLDYFFAWLQHGYRGATEYVPSKGQAVWLAGPVGRGKTFLSEQIVGPMLGGSMDCTSILLGETAFNGPAYEVPLWRVDDASPGKDPRIHAKFSNNVKKMVANHSFEFMAKFRDQARVDWYGRIVVTLNDDPESLRMLPEPDISILDKIMMFRIGAEGIAIPRDGREVVERELPFFGRWLLDWEPPRQTVGANRFGVKEYQEPSLLEEARQAGRAAEFRELLAAFRKSYFASSAEKEWRGNATNLLMAMKVDHDLDDMVKMLKLTPQLAGRELRKLQAMGFAVRQEVRKGSYRWVIARDDASMPSPD